MNDDGFEAMGVLGQWDRGIVASGVSGHDKHEVCVADGCKDRNHFILQWGEQESSGVIFIRALGGEVSRRLLRCFTLNRDKNTCSLHYLTGCIFSNRINIQTIARITALHPTSSG
jgi:hypothetical protein